MNRLSLIAVLLASTIASAETESAAIEKGSKASAALLQKLGGELKAQMQSGGPINALHFCSQNALHLTDEVGRENGVQIKRVSLKNRNPVNRSNAQEQMVLEEWQNLLSKGETLPDYTLKSSPNGGYTFYKPIVINNDACLKCHGDIASDSPLGKEIRALYPEDKATGYKMGDLRGMISVTMQR